MHKVVNQHRFQTNQCIQFLLKIIIRATLCDLYVDASIHSKLLLFTSRDAKHYRELRVGLSVINQRRHISSGALAAVWLSETRSEEMVVDVDSECIHAFEELIFSHTKDTGISGDNLKQWGLDVGSAQWQWNHWADLPDHWMDKSMKYWSIEDTKDVRDYLYNYQTSQRLI